MRKHWDGGILRSAPSVSLRFMRERGGTETRDGCGGFSAHLWILTEPRASRADLLGEGLLTAAVSGEQEEGVAQQTVLGSRQQLLVGERVRVAAPVVHDGVPVAVRERKNSLKRSEGERTEDFPTVTGQ